MALHIDETQIDEIFNRELNIDDLFHHSPFQMTLTDSSGYFKKVNKQWTIITGYTEEELKSEPFINFIHPDDVDRTLNAYNNSESFDKKAKPVVGFVNRYRCKDGRYAILEWHSSGQIVKDLALGFAFFKGYDGK